MSTPSMNTATPPTGASADFPLRTLFAAIDAMDAETFAALLHEDAQFRFGNGDTVRGRAAIRDYVQAFFAALGGIEHRSEETLDAEGQLVCHGQVRYTRHDGSTLEVPFLNLLSVEQGLIRRYLIFIDNSALFAPQG